jgi:hypothetical protein
MKVYRYGLCRPTRNADVVREQMRLAHAYRNRLIEIERGRRTELRAIYGEHLRLVEQAAATAARDVEDAAAALKRERSTVKRLEAALRRVQDGAERHPELAAEMAEFMASEIAAAKKSNKERVDVASVTLKAARAAKREAVAALREARAALREGGELQPEVDAVNAAHAALRREARGECGVYWGTYQLAEDADQASRRQPLYDGAEPNDPRFRRWTGDAAVSVQLIGGRAVEECYGGCTQIEIVGAPPAPGAHPASRRSQTRRRMLLRLRIGSHDDRSPALGRVADGDAPTAAVRTRQAGHGARPARGVARGVVARADARRHRGAAVPRGRVGGGRPRVAPGGSDGRRTRRASKRPRSRDPRSTMDRR